MFLGSRNVPNLPNNVPSRNVGMFGHVAKISMLRLNIGSGKLSSCMLSIGLGPKCEQDKALRGGSPPPCLDRL